MSEPAPPPSHSLFPATAWSRIAAAGGIGVGRSADAGAMEDLCSRYTTPARKFLMAQGCGPQDAEDLVQDFLASWAKPEVMQRLSPSTGRLRSYLKQSLRNLLHNHWRDAKRLKRGGNHHHLPLDEAPELPDAKADAEADRHYDAEWAQTLLSGVLAQLEASYAQREKAALFAALRPMLYAADTVKPYAEIGESVGMKETQIKLEAHRLRRRFGDALRAAVAETVTDQAELEAELAHLLAILAHKA